MTLAGISLSYLRRGNLSTLLNIVLLAFGVAAITVLVLTAEQIEDRMSLDARGIDLVVGAKGSPLQLVLGSVYQLAVETRPIAWNDVEMLAARREVAQAIPIALADHYLGLRIVGTRHAYVAHYGARLRTGALWKAPFEAVAGSAAAARTGLQVGSTISVEHVAGDASDRIHGAHPYRVTGVLRRTGTVLDHLILTDIQSVWTAHEETVDDGLVREPPRNDGRHINALLIRYGTPLAGAALAAEVNAKPDVTAASPKVETARVFAVMFASMRVLRGFAALLMVAAGLSVLIGLHGALTARRYDLAIMRALGASPGQLMALLIFEGALIGTIGAAIGLLLGHTLTGVLGLALRVHQVGITGWTWSPHEMWIVIAAPIAGMAAALVPAWRAHETDIARVLARG